MDGVMTAGLLCILCIQTEVIAWLKYSQSPYYRHQRDSSSDLMKGGGGVGDVNQHESLWESGDMLHQNKVKIWIVK